MSSAKRSLIVAALMYLFLPKISIAQQTNTIRYFLNKTNIKIKPFSLQTSRNGQLHISEWETFRDLYGSMKLLQTKQYYADYRNNLKYIQTTGRVQDKISSEQAFPCPLNNTRSPQPPTSVHRLRPGDIDIIGAMGDSLTAGTGMISKILFHLLIEFRGQTMLGGGLKDWRTYLTLPNILKEFNPNLYGYATANTLAKFRAARFNVAEAFAVTQDMPYMAEVLIKRLQNDPKVDMNKHWKMISIFIGANDVCNDMCYYDNLQDFLENHRKYLHRTLEILRDNIPRLMVNIISIPDIDNVLQTIDVSAACNTLETAFCPCLKGNSITTKQLQERHQALRRFQEIDVEVASLKEFQLDEFAAVPRNLAQNKTLRKLANGRTDMRYFAIDCFHFSQYANAAYTTMLWNDMLQKETPLFTEAKRPFETFECPSEEKPYIETLRNMQDK